MTFSELDKRPGVVLFLAGVTLVGGIAVGKAAIDAAHSKASYPAREGKLMDESVRFIGTIFGITMTLVQLPKAWEEAKKLLESGALPLPVTGP